MKTLTDSQILARRNRLSRAPWAGGYGHYAILDKARQRWATVCHVSAPDSQFIIHFRSAVAKLAA